MPMRASGKELGQSLGSMIFRGQDSRRIKHRLEKIGGDKLQQALEKRGVRNVEIKDIAKAMSGEGEAWSQRKYKQVVQALQDVEVARHAKSASAMVLKAGRNVQGEVIEPGLSPEQFKARMKELARERRAEANAEGASGEALGVLDRARGMMGRANKVSRMTAEAKLKEERGGGSSAGGSVRGLRDELRQRLGLQPKIRLPKPKESPDAGKGFQS